MAILAVGIIILELSFGNWVRNDSLNKLNIVRSKTIKFKIDHVYKSPSSIAVYTRDKYGLRGSFPTPSDISILTVGGSTTDQRYITDGQTWQDVLQRKIQNAGGNIFVGNAGIDGQSTYGHIKNFEWWFNNIPGLKPKYIIFYIGINDLNLDKGRELISEGNKKSFRQIFREKSALYYVGYTLYGIYSAKIEHKAGHGYVDFNKVEWTTSPLQNDYNALMHKRISDYSYRLAVLISKTREFGSIPIIVTQPTRRYRFRNGSIEGVKETLDYGNAKINGIDYFHMITKMYEVTGEICKANNVIFIDMGKERIWDDDDYYDFSHMSPIGARKVGEYLFERIKGIILPT
jgi:hypothetical protein